MNVRSEECQAAGLNAGKVRLVALQLEKTGRMAKSLGLTIFGGAGSGTLRINDDPSNSYSRPLIVANVEGNCFDGGDGAECEDAEGLWRGE